MREATTVGANKRFVKNLLSHTLSHIPTHIDLFRIILNQVWTDYERQQIKILHKVSNW